ncbi:MAG: GAF domain-containing protein [Chloroflexi bacterium]|jgi:GAF domain-containing protein/HAMP domain-containing protein|nr:GAF domain-containing protein [Chloroflexota bacterium]
MNVSSQDDQDTKFQIESEISFLRSLQAKLIAFLLGVSILPLLFVGALTFERSRAALRQQAFDQLVAVRNLKAEQLQVYFDAVEEDIVLTSKFPLIVNSMQAFAQVEDFYAVRLLGYIGHPELADSGQGALYDQMHARYYEEFEALVQAKGYGDIYLVRPDGMVVYNYDKGDDFATNLVSGPYRDTHLATLFGSLRTSTDVNEVQLTDFVPYGPSGGIPASFVGTPIVQEGKNIGVLIYQLPLRRIDDLIQSQAVTIMGQTGEVYLVGEDRLMRTNVPSREESTILAQEVDNHAVTQALAGDTDVIEVISYDGDPTLSAYQPLTFGDHIWVLVAEIETAEALGPATRLRGTVQIIIGIAAFIGIGLGLLITRNITRPISELTRAATAIAEGDLERTVAVRAGGEIGVLAAAFRMMTERLRRSIDQLEARVQERMRASAQRSAYLEASAEVGQASTSILDVDELIQRVVDLIKDRLDVYFVGLLLLDESGEWAVLRAGTGEAGEALLARGLRVPVGEGSMVGWAIANKEARVAQDVSQDIVQLAVPELPKTRSEVALPLRARGEILGALTVEDDKIGAFDRETVNVLQSMVDQIAVALENARLFTELGAALESERRAYGEMVGEAWAQRLRQEGALGFLRQLDGEIHSVSGDRPSSDLIEARKRGERIQKQRAEVAMPVRVRDNVVGAVRFRKPDRMEEWTEGEIGLLEMLTEQLGVALESARLYEATQRRAARERVIREITDEMERATDIESLLRITAEELIKTLGGSRAAVRIGALDLETQLETQIEETQVDDVQVSTAAGDDEGGDD